MPRIFGMLTGELNKIGTAAKKIASATHFVEVSKKLDEARTDGHTKCVEDVDRTVKLPSIADEFTPTIKSEGEKLKVLVDKVCNEFHTWANNQIEVILALHKEAIKNSSPADIAEVPTLWTAFDNELCKKAVDLASVVWAAEKEYNDELDGCQVKTMKARLEEVSKYPQIDCGGGRTRDGVAFPRIVGCCKELGAWAVDGGRRGVAIQFPLGVPLDMSRLSIIALHTGVRTTKLASEIREQLRNRQLLSHDKCGQVTSDCLVRGEIPKR